MNCFDYAAKECRKNGGKLMSGQGKALDGKYYSHCWTERDGQIIDHMGWSDHKGWKGAPAVELYVP